MKLRPSKKWIIPALFTLIIGCLAWSALQKYNPIAFSGTPFSHSNTIAVLPIHGALSISEPQGFSGGSGTDEIVRYLETLSEKNEVKALVIRINSPGGTVAASQEVYHAIVGYKKKRKIPVIISIGDIGASGAFWISMAGDYIFANPGSLVGSIGVIMSNLDLTEVPKHYGINMNTYKSVAHKDILSSWRKASPEEKTIIQNMLTDIQTQFMKTVASSRKLPLSQIKMLADGRVFTGQQALNVHLVDQLGTLQDAIAYAAKTTGIKGKPDIIMPESSSVAHLLNLWKSASPESQIPTSMK